MSELEKYMKEHPEQVQEVYLWDVFHEWGWFYSLIFVFLAIMTIAIPIFIFVNGPPLTVSAISITGLVLCWTMFWIDRPVC